MSVLKGLAKFMAWRWMPFFALIGGSLAFVALVVLIMPSSLGSHFQQPPAFEAPAFTPSVVHSVGPGTARSQRGLLPARAAPAYVNAPLSTNAAAPRPAALPTTPAAPAALREPSPAAQAPPRRLEAPVPPAPPVSPRVPFEIGRARLLAPPALHPAPPENAGSPDSPPPSDRTAEEPTGRGE